MYFDLTDEQKMLQDSVGSFLAKQNHDSALMRYIDADQPEDALWPGLTADLGLSAILVPEAHGGLGMDLLTQAVVIEAMGYYAAPGPLLYHSLVTLAVALGGSEAQRRQWLPKLASGEIQATTAFAEPAANGLWQSEQWRLNGKRPSGTKTHVVDADRAQLLLVGLEGGRLGLVENGEGITVEAIESLDRTRRLYTVNFDNAPCELLNTVDPAAIRDAALVLHAADAFGAARRCLDMAVEYAKERQQFGRVIGSFQSLKHQLANAAESLEPCRALYWYAAHAFDAVPDDAERAAALAKSHIGETAVRVARTTVEAHGGIGYTWEYPLHALLKRAMFDRAYLGDPAAHRQRIANLNGW